MDIQLTIFEKACCEATWRAATERGDLQAPLHVDTRRPDARRELALLVQHLPTYVLTSVTLREINAYGRLPGGYAARWETSCLKPPYHVPLPPPGLRLEDMAARQQASGTTLTSATIEDDVTDDDSTTQVPQGR